MPQIKCFEFLRHVGSTALYISGEKGRLTGGNKNGCWPLFSTPGLFLSPPKELCLGPQTGLPEETTSVPHPTDASSTDGQHILGISPRPPPSSPAATTPFPQRALLSRSEKNKSDPIASLVPSSWQRKTPLEADAASSLEEPLP